DNERRKLCTQRKCKLHMAAQSATSAAQVTSLRFASNARANFFDPLLQLRKMGPRPVYLSAVETAAELVVIDFGKPLEFVHYFGFVCFLQRALHRRHRVKGAINSERSKRRITSIVCSSGFWERG